MYFINKNLTKYNRNINIVETTIFINNEFRIANTISRSSLLNNSRDITIRAFIRSEDETSKRLTRRKIENIYNIVIVEIIIVLDDRFESYYEKIKKSLHEIKIKI